MNKLSLAGESRNWWLPSAVAGGIGTVALGAILILPTSGQSASEKTRRTPPRSRSRPATASVSRAPHSGPRGPTASTSSPTRSAGDAADPSPATHRPGGRARARKHRRERKARPCRRPFRPRFTCRTTFRARLAGRRYSTYLACSDTCALLPARDARHRPARRLTGAERALYQVWHPPVSRWLSRRYLLGIERVDGFRAGRNLSEWRSRSSDR